MPLLDAVLKEAMRLVTPVPMITMRSIVDCEIAGQHLPRRSRVLIAPHLIHRMPELYDTGDRFRPGRWFSIKPSTYEYLPFGAGRRRCPGYWLAMTNVKLAVMAILSRFRPQLPDGARIDRMYAGVTTPKNGVPIRLLPRNGASPRPAAASYSGSIFELFTPEPDRRAIS
jgi:cytochrome P450